MKGEYIRVRRGQGGQVAITSREERLFLPCPCGSRLPYIDCCGNRVVKLESLRLSRLARGLKRKLSHFAQHPAFTEAAVWAQHLYLSEIAGSLLSLDEEFVGERCFEWFIFDFPVAGEHTVLDLFLRLYWEELSEEERELLRFWCRAPNSFYEVKAVGRERILLQDLFSRGKYIARGFAREAELSRGLILYLRLLRVGEEYEFSTAALSLAPETKPVIKAWLSQDYEAYKEARGKKRLPWSTYLRERSHRIMAWASFLSSGRDEKRAEQEGVWGEKLDRLLVQLEEQLLQKATLGSVAWEEEERLEEEQAWARPEYAEVARLVARDLRARGSGPQVGRALALWHRFCAVARPTIRKAAAWVAALVYAVNRLEGNRAVNQQRLADEYGVSVSSVSVKYRLLCRSLGLE
ncbi:hypothetical protein DXX99_04385 [Ammonifex thiophilus]|uniref:SEC-C domain-containing protein n=1 Tax=Ammonifex thiophilus TaxID=444093 RepID=A0A3D8P4N0_9THEO|nr:hypothetical protein DXX99_04385 [Ammonifex thiophilus]